MLTNTGIWLRSMFCVLHSHMLYLHLCPCLCYLALGRDLVSLWILVTSILYATNNTLLLLTCSIRNILYLWHHFRYGVTGFPTLKFFPKGNKAGEDYDGGRDLGDFVKFINEKSGTSRDTKGQLTSEVGYICTILHLWIQANANSGSIILLGWPRSKSGCPG
jgi:hypothetical protein